MKMYFTSDWHLGDNRMYVWERPFKTTEENTEHLLKCHNSIVSEEDLVYVIGDVIYLKADSSQYLPIINSFNGRKILIKGNHDANISDEQFSPYFEQIFQEKDGLLLDIDGISCYLNHYPSLGRPDRLNLVGHIHSCWEIQLNCINVGVDVHHFYPMDVERLKFLYNKICKFSDDDVWAGYLELNKRYLGIRGNKGSYVDVV